MWSRALFFPEPIVDAAPPMWNRPSDCGGHIISLDPIVTKTPMWHRPLAHAADAVPIFEVAVPSPSQMWHRASTGMPSCPCCTMPTSPVEASHEMVEPRDDHYREHGTAPAAASPVSTFYRPYTATPPPYSPPQDRALRHQSSAISLRIRRSIARLRRRPSLTSL